MKEKNRDTIPHNSTRHILLTQILQENLQRLPSDKDQTQTDVGFNLKEMSHNPTS